MYIDETREQLPRLATLPFDPSYKLMATFNQAKDAAGNDVVRCFVKGAAPAVMSRAATALSNGVSIPWDDTIKQRAEQHVERMGQQGLRVMAGAFRDLDAASFDPDGDLLALVEGLEMTSLVGMVDPPREESKAAVSDAQAAHIRVRMVTGDDVVTGAAIAKQLNIPGRQSSAPSSPRCPKRSGSSESRASASSAGSPPSTRCSSPKPSRKRATSWR